MHRRPQLASGKRTQREKKPGAEPRSEQPAPILLKTEIRTSTVAAGLGDRRKKNELGPVPDGSLDEEKTRPTRAEPEFSGARDRATKTRIPAANRRDFERTGQQTSRRPTKLHRGIWRGLCGSWAANPRGPAPGAVPKHTGEKDQIEQAENRERRAEATLGFRTASAAKMTRKRKIGGQFAPLRGNREQHNQNAERETKTEKGKSATGNFRSSEKEK
jgi:hypothetical protein